VTARIFGLPEPAARLTMAALVIAGAVIALIVLGWVVPRLARRVPVNGGDPARSRQRQTAVALMATALRYLVVVTAAVALLIVLAGGGGLGALGGSALVVAIVGFASQRLLGDIIAGFFILFENQYGVGDFVRLEPSGHTGVVKELGLRTTVIHDLNGDRCFVPNGSITAVRRVTGGRRRLIVDLLTPEPDALAPVVRDLAAAMPPDLAALGPHELERVPAGEGLVRVRLELEMPPALEPAVREFVLAGLSARAGDAVVGEPLVTSLDGKAMARYGESLARA
jgi:moderate conductance mechanosensitive channel